MQINVTTLPRRLQLVAYSPHNVVVIGKRFSSLPEAHADLCRILAHPAMDEYHRADVERLRDTLAALRPGDFQHEDEDMTEKEIIMGLRRLAHECVDEYIRQVPLDDPLHLVAPLPEDWDAYRDFFADLDGEAPPLLLAALSTQGTLVFRREYHQRIIEYRRGERERI